jgi:hypothetical protein
MSFEDDKFDIKNIIKEECELWIKCAIEAGFTKEQAEFLEKTCRNSIINAILNGTF